MTRTKTPRRLLLFFGLCMPNGCVIWTYIHQTTPNHQNGHWLACLISRVIMCYVPFARSFKARGRQPAAGGGGGEERRKRQPLEGTKHRTDKGKQSDRGHTTRRSHKSTSLAFKWFLLTRLSKLKIFTMCVIFCCCCCFVSASAVGIGFLFLHIIINTQTDGRYCSYLNLSLCLFHRFHFMLLLLKAQLLSASCQSLLLIWNLKRHHLSEAGSMNRWKQQETLQL